MSAIATLPPPSHPHPPASEPGIVACIDCTDRNAWVYPHAAVLAAALDFPVTLLQVLDAAASPDVRPDPIEWNLRRREALRALGRCATTAWGPPPQTTIELAEGQTAEEICRFIGERSDDLIVLGRRGKRELGKGGMGGTAQKILAHAPSPILLVPVEAQPPDQSYRRILVPLDGSRWAESVLPLAARIARATKAEILLAHVVPAPEMLEAQPLEAEDKELRQNLIERNEQAARNYLQRVKSNLAATGLRVRTLSIRADDVREALNELIQKEAADLTVMSARGHSRQHATEVPYGTVASYLMAHCTVPMLVLPTTVRSPQTLLRSANEEIRLPLGGQA